MKTFRSNAEHAKHAKVETSSRVRFFWVGLESSRSPGVAPIPAVGEMITTPTNSACSACSAFDLKPRLLCRSRSRIRGGFLRADAEELDVEDEGGAAGDGRRVAVVAVRDVRRADQARFLPDLHLLDAFGPALDHLVQAELGRLPPLVGGVEDVAVGEAAFVVDLHLVGRGGARTVARRQRLEDEPVGQLGRALLLRRLVREVAAGDLLLVGPRGGSLLRERVHLLHLRLGLDHGLLPQRAVGEPALHDLQLARLQRERGDVPAADQESDRVEGLLVVGLQRLFGGSGEREEHGERKSETHEGPFGRGGQTVRYFSTSWVIAIRSFPAFSFRGSTRIPPTRMVPPRWMA